MGDRVEKAAVRRWAELSADGEHRLVLGRQWSADLPLVAFIGLNPSTADATSDDPTVRRCVGFARAWGFGGLLLANLFTFRAADPRVLAACKTPLTFGADHALRDVGLQASLVIEAWGAHAMASSTGRDRHVRALLAGRAPRAVLGLTQDGAPRHPLYAPAETVPQLVSGGAAVGLRVEGPADLPGGTPRPRVIRGADGVRRQRTGPFPLG